MTMKFWTMFSMPIQANTTLYLQVESFNYTMPVYFKIRFTDNVTAGFNETKVGNTLKLFPLLFLPFINLFPIIPLYY